MKEPFDLNGKTVEQIPIGSEETCHPGADCVVAGWGLTVTRIEIFDCNSIYLEYIIVKLNPKCASIGVLSYLP